MIANFRTVEPIIGWVNDTFATLMGEPIDDALPENIDSQPKYLALEATRVAPDTRPAVAIIGRDEYPKGPRPTSYAPPKRTRWR